jgi:hypothetical protein
MATVNKDFKIKSGLIVEGTTATVNGFDVLTKKQADQDYVVGLIGGTATSANEANKVVKRDASGNFAAGTITANVTGNVTGTVSSLSNHDTADLAEGTNLYFTNQRALDATAAAYDVAGAASAAQSAAATDATNKANAVAGDLTDHENATVAHGATGAVVGTTNTQTLTNKTIGDTLNFTGAGAMTINSDSHIVLTPAAGSSVKWGADVLATQGYADQAETDAKAYTDTREGLITTAYEAYADQAEVDAKAYADQKVADLVDSAPALLDTLNELAAAIGEDASFATTIGTQIGEKVAKAGDTMTGALTLSGAPTSNLHAATKAYVDGEVSSAASTAATAAADALTDANAYTDGEITTALSTAQGYADTAEADANSYTDGEITDALVTAQGYASTAQGNAQTHTTNAINALDTDDIEEGPTNLYFTDGRAKTSAAALLTGATLTNITISGTGAGLTITAENGVADSDTDDLVEGVDNLYFTPTRAFNALQGSTSNFSAVDLNSVAKQVASTLEAPTAGIQLAHSWLKADYRSAEFLVKVAYGTHTEISKVLLTLDTSDNIAITEYGIVGTNGSASSISAAISNSGRAVELQVTTANNNSTVTVVGTLLK